MKGKESSNQQSSIIEVYENNFVQEIKHLGNYLEKYPFIGMDTEFPGTVYPCPQYKKGFYYSFIKANVDKLKLIQLGITLCNEKGESPTEVSTWQFNLRFNPEKEKHSSESLEMLSNSGIDFGVMKKKGIHYSQFAEYFFVSGLVLNNNVKWISFNGLSDFAYLLRLCLNSNLPENENDFLQCLSLYFPNFYDIKILVGNKDNLKGSLNRLAQQLNVERIGDTHQAGSDSIVTADVYFALVQCDYVSIEEIAEKKNILFGIGLGADDQETFQYTQFAQTQNVPHMGNQSIPLYPTYDPYYPQVQQYSQYIQYQNQPFNQSQKTKNSFDLLMAYSN